METHNFTRKTLLDGTIRPVHPLRTGTTINGVKVTATWAGGHTVNLFTDGHNFAVRSVGDFKNDHMTIDEWLAFKQDLKADTELRTAVLEELYGHPVVDW